VFCRRSRYTKAGKQEEGKTAFFPDLISQWLSSAGWTHPVKTSEVTWFLTSVRYYIENFAFFKKTLFLLKTVAEHLCSDGIEAW